MRDHRDRRVHPAYFLFSSLAGQVADAGQARLVRLVTAEVGDSGRRSGLDLSMITAADVPVPDGMHSTIFGPVKCTFCRSICAATEVMGGTGLVEGRTFIVLGGSNCWRA